MNTKLAASAVLLVLTLAGSHDQSQSQKPVRVVQTHTDGDIVPDTLTQLVDNSELVVIGTVVAVRPADRTFKLPDEPGTQSWVRTAYRIKLKESFLVPDDFEPRIDSIEVGIYFAGDRDRGDHIARYVPERARGLQEGETLLLFLKADVDQVWRLATGNGNSIVAIKGTAVAPQAASSLAMGLAQKSWVVLRRELLETVKKKVGR